MRVHPCRGRTPPYPVDDGIAETPQEAVPTTAVRDELHSRHIKVRYSALSRGIRRVAFICVAPELHARQRARGFHLALSERIRRKGMQRSGVRVRKQRLDDREAVA